MVLYGSVIWKNVQQTKPNQCGLTIMCAAALVATKDAEQAVSTVTLGPVRPRVWESREQVTKPLLLVNLCRTGSFLTEVFKQEVENPEKGPLNMLKLKHVAASKTEKNDGPVSKSCQGTHSDPSSCRSCSIPTPSRP